MKIENLRKLLVCPRSSLGVRRDLEVLNSVKISVEAMENLWFKGFAPYWLLDGEYDVCDGYEHLSLTAEKSILRLKRLEQMPITLTISGDWEDGSLIMLYQATIKRYANHYVLSNITYTCGDYIK